MAIKEESTKALLKIMHGDVADLKLNEPTILVGKRMRNKVLRMFVEEYRKISGFDDRMIIEMMLALDEAIEKEYLTHELLLEIKENPKLLNLKKNK